MLCRRKLPWYATETYIAWRLGQPTQRLCTSAANIQHPWEHGKCSCTAIPRTSADDTHCNYRLLEHAIILRLIYNTQPISEREVRPKDAGSFEIYSVLYTTTKESEGKNSINWCPDRGGCVCRFAETCGEVAQLREYTALHSQITWKFLWFPGGGVYEFSCSIKISSLVRLRITGGITGEPILTLQTDHTPGFRVAPNAVQESGISRAIVKTCSSCSNSWSSG